MPNEAVPEAREGTKFFPRPSIEPGPLGRLMRVGSVPLAACEGVAAARKATTTRAAAAPRCPMAFLRGRARLLADGPVVMMQVQHDVVELLEIEVHVGRLTEIDDQLVRGRDWTPVELRIKRRA